MKQIWDKIVNYFDLNSEDKEDVQAALIVELKESIRLRDELIEIKDKHIELLKEQVRVYKDQE